VVGLSTAEAIDPDPFARAAAIGTWRRRPDFVSVNLSELGWGEIFRAAVRAGNPVEVGLASPSDAEAFARSGFTHQVLRALIEIDGGVEEALAVSRLLADGIPQLWHGYGERTWEVIAAGAAKGHDVRVGLEDVLVLPGGEPAADNAELVKAAALAISGGT
jgi:uncharacterized protein (DUF849 family)